MRAGIGHHRFHATRHTAATLLLEADVPLEVVSAILGHASLAITADVYAQVTQDSKRRALTKLDDLSIDREPGTSPVDGRPHSAGDSIIQGQTADFGSHFGSTPG